MLQAQARGGQTSLADYNRESDNEHQKREPSLGKKKERRQGTPGPQQTEVETPDSKRKNRPPELSLLLLFATLRVHPQKFRLGQSASLEARPSSRKLGTDGLGRAEDSVEGPVESEGVEEEEHHQSRLQHEGANQADIQGVAEHGEHEGNHTAFKADGVKKAAPKSSLTRGLTRLPALEQGVEEDVPDDGDD